MQLLLSNLHPQLSEAHLLDLLGEFGEVRKLQWQDLGKTAVTVEMPCQDGEVVIEYLNGDMVMGRPILIQKHPAMEPSIDKHLGQSVAIPAASYSQQTA